MTDLVVRRHSEQPLSKQAAALLVKLIDQAFQDGWRTADDFLRHFSATDIVESLANDEELRVQMLVRTTNMHEKIARKKTIASGAEDLGLALAEGTSDASKVLELYPTEARVRYLDTGRLWSFLTEGDFWTAGPKDSPQHQRAVSRMTFTLETTLAEGLISLQSIADGISFDEIAVSLPKKELEQVVTRALKVGRSGLSLTEELLLEVVPLKALVGYVDLSSIWNRVVLERIAGPCGFKKSAPSPTERSSQFPGSSGAKSQPRRQPPSEPPAAVHTPSTQAGSTAATPSADQRALEAVRDRLRAIGRLPRDESLPFSLLMSIETLYVEIKDAGSDTERTEAIREAFPNEAQIRSALLSLIDLLDPGMKTKDPSLQDADVETLIKIFLLEERRRREGARVTSSIPPAPPVGSRQRSRSLPPPLPRATGKEVELELEAEADA